MTIEEKIVCWVVAIVLTLLVGTQAALFICRNELGPVETSGPAAGTRVDNRGCLCRWLTDDEGKGRR